MMVLLMMRMIRQRRMIHMRMAAMILTTANIKVRTMATDRRFFQYGQKCLLLSSPYSLCVPLFSGRSWDSYRYAKLCRRQKMLLVLMCNETA